MSKSLTPELILSKTKNDNLLLIKNLNLWGNDLGLFIRILLNYLIFQHR